MILRNGKKFCVYRLENNVYMIVSSKAIYRNRKTLKIQMEFQFIPNSQKSLEKEQTFEGFIPTDFKIYFKPQQSKQCGTAITNGLELKAQK